MADETPQKIQDVQVVNDANHPVPVKIHDLDQGTHLRVKFTENAPVTAVNLQTPPLVAVGERRTLYYHMNQSANVEIREIRGVWLLCFGVFWFSNATAVEAWINSTQLISIR